MRIVVADASRVVLKIMIKLLTDHGHVAFGFTTGEEALAKLVEDPSVDVLITSLELSGMSGFELCWECRVMTKREQQLYILAMSSLAAHERLAEALDSGADDFIGKPPNPEELFARLRAAERFAMTQRQLVRLATRDTLTGLLNRRANGCPGRRVIPGRACPTAAPSSKARRRLPSGAAISRSPS